MRRKLVPFTFWGAVIYIALLILVGSSLASRYQDQPVLSTGAIEEIPLAHQGHAREVIVSGTGFDRNTRIVLSADDGNHYALSPGVPLWGMANDLVMIDDMMFIANTQLGLQALHVEDPLQPTVEKPYPTASRPVAVDADDARLYLTCTHEGVVIYDRNDPHELQKLATVQIKGQTLASQVSGNLLFAASAYGDVQIIDISNLSSSRADYPLISTIQTKSKAIDIVLEDNLLFIVTQTSGLYVYDVGSPKHPRHLTTFETEESITAITVEDSTLYLGFKNGEISLFDIRNPLELILTGGYNTGGKPADIRVRENRLYLADGEYGLISLDISDPKHIDLVGMVNIPGQARSVLLFNDLAYVTSNSMGLQIVNLELMEKTEVRSSIDTPGHASWLQLDGDWLYVADVSSLKVIRRSKVGELEIVASLPADEYFRIFLKKDNYLFLSDGKFGLSIIDVSDPLHPKKVSQLGLPGISGPLVIVENRLFMASYRGGLQIVDIADPYIPWLVETVPLEGLVRDVATDGRYLYVSTALVGTIQIYELDSEQNPRWISEIVHPWPLNQFSQVMALEVRDGQLFVASGRNGLQIYDVRDPFHISMIGAVDFPGFIKRLSIDGNHVFVVDGQKGLYMVDISDTSHPRNLGCVVSRTGLLDIQFDGNSLFLGTGHSGVIETFRPMELEDISLEDSQRFKAKVPYPGSDGRYSLHVSSPEQQSTLHGVLDFSALKL